MATAEEVMADMAAMKDMIVQLQQQQQQATVAASTTSAAATAELHRMQVEMAAVKAENGTLIQMRSHGSNDQRGLIDGGYWLDCKYWKTTTNGPIGVQVSKTPSEQEAIQRQGQHWVLWRTCRRRVPWEMVNCSPLDPIRRPMQPVRSRPLMVDTHGQLSAWEMTSGWRGLGTYTIYLKI